MAKTNEPILKLPVSRTGVYLNASAGQFEFWFVLHKGKAMVGACRFEVPKAKRDQWIRHTRRQLQEMVVSTIKREAMLRKAEADAIERRLY